MNPMRKLFGHLVGGLGIYGFALFFLFFSCGQKMPTAPPEQFPALSSVTTGQSAPNGFIKNPNTKTGKYIEALDFGLGEPGVETVVMFEPDSLNYLAIDAGETVEKSVGPSGYTIKFPIGTKDTAFLVVPDGALDQNWNLNLRANLVPTRDEKMSVALHEFFPEELVFLKDCYLVQPTRFPDGTLLALSWFNPISEEWEEESVAASKTAKRSLSSSIFPPMEPPMTGTGSVREGSSRMSDLAIGENKESFQTQNKRCRERSFYATTA